MLTDDERASRALEASRVLTDDTITAACADMRRGALEALVKVEPTDTTKIMQLQAYVAAVDAFQGQLEIYVSQAPQKPRGGLA